MNDLISRQAAIDACLELLEARRKWDTAEGRAEMRGIDAVMCAIHGLSSAQPDVPDTNVDTISRQVAIELAMQYCPDDDGTCSKADEDIRNLLDELEDLPPAQPEPHWIPCSERLPERIKSSYWICTEAGYQCQCRWTNNVFGLGDGDIWSWKVLDIPRYSRVVAWMPLPEPYTERREE